MLLNITNKDTLKSQTDRTLSATMTTKHHKLYQHSMRQIDVVYIEWYMNPCTNTDMYNT